MAKDAPPPPPEKKNPKARPHLAEANKKTRFKKGNIEQKKKPFHHETIRKTLAYLSLQPISGDMEKLDKELARLALDGRGQTSPGRLFAVRLMEKAIKKMEAPIAQLFIESIEGKLPETINMPPKEKAPTEFLTDEQAEAAYLKYIKQ